MFKRLGKKVATAVMTGSMLVGTMATSALISTPVYAQWPDPGYNHIPQEDRTFSTNQEAVDYANQYGYSIYQKYNCKIEFEVVYDGPGKFRTVFYGYGYSGGSGSSSSSTSTELNKTVKWEGRVTGDGLRVRTWAGTEYAECSFSPLNTDDIVEVCDTVSSSMGDWYYIKYNGLYGFVFSQYVEQISPYGAPDTGKSQTESSVQFTAVVTTDILNVRTDAGTEYPTANWSPIYNGMLVNVIGQKKDSQGINWFQVQSNDHTGWCSSYYITLAAVQTCVDVTPDATEKAFANGKTMLKEETRYFFTEKRAVEWASGSEAGNYLWNKYQKSLYFYVADVSTNVYVVHFYG